MEQKLMIEIGGKAIPSHLMGVRFHTVLIDRDLDVAKVKV